MSRPARYSRAPSASGASTQLPGEPVLRHRDRAEERLAADRDPRAPRVSGITMPTRRADLAHRGGIVHARAASSAR